MPIQGSAARLYKRQLLTVPALMKATAEESLEQLKDDIRQKTPVGTTGRLRESINSLPVIRSGQTGIYIGQVQTTLHYAPHVEYGTAAHVIRPKDAEALKFNGRFAEEAHIKAHPGAHMFQRGAKEFARTSAHVIARKNLKIWAEG